MQLLEAARLELIAATEYYNAVSASLALAFLEEVEDAFKKISEAPKLWPQGNWGTHRYVLGRFPYAVVYIDSGEFPQVIAVAHGKRKPEYWRERVPERK